MAIPPDSRPQFRVAVEGTPRELSPDARDAAYRIVREALRNSYHHAKATRIETAISYRDTALSIRVRDDGIGVDPQTLARGQRPGHWGFPGMRERSEAIGGRFTVWSQKEGGTEVELRISAVAAYAEPPKSTFSWVKRVLSKH